MKINLAAVLIRSITVIEKTECMAEAAKNITKKCFLMRNHDKTNKWYDEDTERRNEECSKC